MHLLGVVVQAGLVGAVIVFGIVVANGWGYGGNDEPRTSKDGDE